MSGAWAVSFFFNDTATTEIYTLSLHDALPIWALVSGAFGSAAWSVPMLLGLLSWRYLRHPDRNAETGRMVIGWSAMIVGALGLVHIANGTPPPTAGADAMRAAGGFIGFFASAPVVAAVTPWIAAPLLALICGLGALVITATPVHRIPERLAELHGFMWRDNAARGGADSAAGSGAPEDVVGEVGSRRGPGHLLRGQRSRRTAIEPGEHEKPYDTPLLGRGHAAGRLPAPDADTAGMPRRAGPLSGAAHAGQDSGPRAGDGDP